MNRNSKENGNKQLLTLIDKQEKKSIRKNSTNSGAQESE